jgi:hypothetical protein
MLITAKYVTEEQRVNTSSDDIHGCLCAGENVHVCPTCDGQFCDCTKELWHTVDGAISCCVECFDLANPEDED